MVNFDRHVFAGVIVGIIGSFVFKNPILLLVGALYSLIPDLDLNNTIPFRWFLTATCAYAIYMLVRDQDYMTELFGYLFPQRYFAVPPLLFVIFLQFIQHREFFHSILAGILFSVPLLFFFDWQGFLIGLLSFYSHLMLDKEFMDGIIT